MSKVIFIITYPIRLILCGIIYIYKFLVSPLMGKTCRFKPSCSTYMLLAIKEWGVVNGTLRGIYRIIRCNPFNKHVGLDMVPYNIKGENKWKF